MANNKTPVYLHVGFPKSASTTLQLELFGSHSEILNLGKGAGGVKGKYKDKDIEDLYKS